MSYLNKNTIKYFINLLTITSNNNKLPYFPREIREIIWEKFFTVNYISCNICNQVIIDFSININEPINTESIIMSNGIINCLNCR